MDKLDPLKRHLKTLTRIMADLERITRPVPRHDMDLPLDDLDDGGEALPEHLNQPPDPDGCTCFWTPESTWTRYGSAVEPGSQREWNPGCIVHPPQDGSYYVPEHFQLIEPPMDPFPAMVEGFGADWRELALQPPLWSDAVYDPIEVGPDPSEYIDPFFAWEPRSGEPASNPDETTEHLLEWPDWAIPAILDVLATHHYCLTYGTNTRVEPHCRCGRQFTGPELDTQIDWREHVAPIIAARVGCNPVRAIEALSRYTPPAR